MKIGTVKHKDRLFKTIKACIENGQRLHDDAEWLGAERSASAIALCILAQEEFAKAFLLYLVCEKTIPWTPKVRNSLHNHKYKQLLGLIMEWLRPSYDEFSERMKRSPLEFNMPVCIADAIKLYVEKVQPQGHISCPPEVSDPRAKSVADGDRDLAKQDSLYVRLSKDGELISVPASFPPEIVEAELDRTKRFCDLVTPFKEGKIGLALEYHLLLETMSFFLLDKRNRPFLILKETELGGVVTLPTGIIWPHSIKMCVENISHEQATCISGHAMIFLNKKVVRPSFYFDQFVLDPYTANFYNFFFSEETYVCGISPTNEFELHINLEYQGVTSGYKYHVSMWSTYNPNTGNFFERLTDSQESVNGGFQSKGSLETSWRWPKKL